MKQFRIFLSIDDKRTNMRAKWPFPCFKNSAFIKQQLLSSQPLFSFQLFFAPHSIYLSHSRHLLKDPPCSTCQASNDRLTQLGTGLWTKEQRTEQQNRNMAQRPNTEPRLLNVLPPLTQGSNTVQKAHCGVLKKNDTWFLIGGLAYAERLWIGFFCFFWMGLLPD